MQNHLQEGLVFFTDLTNFGRVTKQMELSQVADLLTTFAEITNRTITKGDGHIIDYMNGLIRCCVTSCYLGE